MTVVAISGHRPEKIVDIGVAEKFLIDAFQLTGATYVIQGMAAGIDLLAARTAFRMNIPFISARPWRTHGPQSGDEGMYQNALDFACEVVDVTDYERFPGAWVYQKRNEWMVDHAEIIVAYCDGSPSGTLNCINYAQSQEKPVYWFDPEAGYAVWE